MGAFGATPAGHQLNAKNRCLLESNFERILVDFGRENGAKLAPKYDQNGGINASKRLDDQDRLPNRPGWLRKNPGGLFF